MLKRVSIRNFQSLERVDLEMAPITVVVGRSRAGKSGLVRALQSAFFNQTGDSFITDGARSASVSLEFADGTAFDWEKVSGKGGLYHVYAADGTMQTISRVGKDMPPDLLRFGVREIEADGLKARLQFSDQHSAPFLLSATGGQAAKLLARVTKLDVLVQAQVLARRDAGRAKAAATQAADEARRLRDKLEGQPDYAALVRHCAALEQRDAVARADLDIAGKARELVVRRRRLQALASAWAETDLPQRVTAARDQAVSTADLAALVQRLDIAKRATVGALQKVESARRDLSGMEGELHELLGGMEVCPVCGTVLKTAKEGNQ